VTTVLRRRLLSAACAKPATLGQMKAVTCTDAKFEVVDQPTPTPAKGQLLINVLRCRICGSDLHARNHCDEVADVMAETGYPDFMRSNQSVVFGHEFCGEVLDHGPGTRKAPRAGTPVVAMPLLRRGKEVHALGLSTAAPGAYAEQLVVEQSVTLPVPNGLPPEQAALTEPMAVGWHAVQRGEVKKGQVAIVIGCGPIGLAAILMLKAHGVRTVIASDFSSGRRALATECGADVVVDPAQDSPYKAASGHGHLETPLDAFDLAIGTIEKLQLVRLPWWHVWRAADKLGAATPKHPVIFECVGVPGIDATPLITGTVGLNGVENAFDALGDPEAHAKILIDPKSDTTTPG
jgi:threonine dehydrogenase-like Zn-dependent dehydrogenase